MKRINKTACTVLALSLLISLGTSCTKQMEGLNRDPKQISDQDLEQDANAGGFLLPTMMNRILSTSTSSQTQQNLEADSYAGYLETPTPFLNNENTVTYFMVGRYIDNTWNVSTQGVMDNWLLMYKNGIQDKYPDLYAIALIIKGMAAQRMVDAFGPYPYTKYGSAAEVEFDSGKDAYAAIYADLTTAVKNLQAAEAADPNADQVRFAKWDGSTLKGEYTNWIKLANTERLRMAMHISLVNPTLAKQWAEEAVDPANGGVLDASTGSFAVYAATVNPYYTYVNAWSDCRLSASIQTYLEGFGDPRLPVYALPAEDPELGGAIRGIRAGSAKPSKDRYVNFSKPNITPDMPVKQMDVAESYFLRAEGALRGWNMGGDAKTFYEEGIRVSFQANGVSGVDDYLQSTTTQVPYVDPKNPANDTTAVSDVTVKWDDGATFDQKLEKIITQKWVAMFPEGSEGWTEFRRTGYPKMYPIKESHNPELPYGTFIKRLTYPPAVTNSSQAQVDAAVKAYLGGHDSAAQPLWWDID